MYFNILKLKILIKVSIRNESGVQVHGTGLPDASEGALNSGEILPSAQRRPIETSIYLNRIFSLFVSTHFMDFVCILSECGSVYFVHHVRTDSGSFEHGFGP